MLESLFNKVAGLKPLDFSLQTSLIWVSTEADGVKIGVLENFLNFTGKHLCWRRTALLKRYPRQLFSYKI